MTRGRLVVFEGCHLSNRQQLAEQIAIKSSALLLRFPNYNSPTGIQLKAYEEQHHSDIHTNHIQLPHPEEHQQIQELYARNSLESARIIFDTLDNGRDVVTDGYVYSGWVRNFIFFGQDYKKSYRLDYGMPHPDCIFFCPIKIIKTEPTPKELYHHVFNADFYLLFFTDLGLNTNPIHLVLVEDSNSRIIAQSELQKIFLYIKNLTPTTNIQTL